MFKKLLITAALVAGTATSALAVDRFNGDYSDTFSTYSSTNWELLDVNTLIEKRNIFIAVRDVQRARPAGKAYWGRPEWRHYYELRLAAKNEFDLEISDFFGDHIKNDFYNTRKSFLNKYYGNAWANPFGGEFSDIVEEDIRGAVLSHKEFLEDNGLTGGQNSLLAHYDFGGLDTSNQHAIGIEQVTANGLYSYYADFNGTWAFTMSVDLETGVFSFSEAAQGLSITRDSFDGLVEFIEESTHYLDPSHSSASNIDRVQSVLDGLEFALTGETMWIASCSDDARDLYMEVLDTVISSGGGVDNSVVNTNNALLEDMGAYVVYTAGHNGHSFFIGIRPVAGGQGHEFTGGSMADTLPTHCS